jgi:hypothetical protein
VRVFDILGCEVATLAEEQMQAGTYGVSFDGARFGSGVYYYRLQAGGFSQVRKMLLVK